MDDDPNLDWSSDVFDNSNAALLSCEEYSSDSSSDESICWLIPYPSSMCGKGATQEGDLFVLFQNISPTHLYGTKKKQRQEVE